MKIDEKTEVKLYYGAFTVVWLVFAGFALTDDSLAYRITSMIVLLCATVGLVINTRLSGLYALRDEKKAHYKSVDDMLAVAFVYHKQAYHGQPHESEQSFIDRNYGETPEQRVIRLEKNA